MGGTDDENNLVNLTAREHYIAHLLLVKVTEQNGDETAHSKMLYAFNCMKWGRCDGERSFKFNSRLYQKVKKHYSELRRAMMKTSHNPSFGKKWVMNRQLQKCKCVDSSYVLEDGWEYGRCFFNPDVLKKRELAKQKIKERQEQRIQKWREMYLFFVKHNNDFNLMAKTFNYVYTRNNFMNACKKFLPEYIPLPSGRQKKRK